MYASTPIRGEPVNGQYFTLQAGSPAKLHGRANVNDAPAGALVDMGAYPNGAADVVGPRRRSLPVTGLSGSASVNN